MSNRNLMSLLCATTVAIASGAEIPAPIVQNLPTGVTITKTIEMGRGQLPGIEASLGGKISRITNSFFVVHGRPIQVNIIRATDEKNAKQISDALSRIKPSPWSLRRGDSVIEFVVRNQARTEPALAIKTAFELGLQPKPKVVSFQVQAKLATVDAVDDYMTCNAVLNAFLRSESDRDTARPELETMAAKFDLGNSLFLRAPQLQPSTYEFAPEPIGIETGLASTRYQYANLKSVHGFPFVNVTMQIQTTGSGLSRQTAAPDRSLTKATEFWPADDAEVRELAAQITAGKNSHGAKAMAIMRWLKPGKQIRYAGTTGSRWGTRKVLQQKFGHCWDFSDCFVTLARAAGVPARQVAGWLYGSSGHVWAEFYREGIGWQQVDPTGGGDLRCGIYHIPYFTSETGEMPIVYLDLPQIQLIDGFSD